MDSHAVKSSRCKTDITLHAGSDLHNASAKSSVGSEPGNTVRGLWNIVAIGFDAMKGRVSHPADRQYEFVELQTSLPSTDTNVSVMYAGDGINRAYCLSLVCGRKPEVLRQHRGSKREVTEMLKQRASGSGFVFADGVNPNDAGKGARKFARMPAWIKQRVPIQENWSDQIASLRRGTRQEVSRILRKAHHKCELTRCPGDIADFYERLYCPYLLERFRDSALIVDQSTFWKECSRGLVLQLKRDDVVSGAALLRRVGNTLAVVWSAVDIRLDRTRRTGLFDSMDYFSLLYGHLTGCRWLDLGPSRADLFDGILQYKSKWGAMVTAGRVPQRTIFWACPSNNAIGRIFLKDHAFVVKIRGRLTGVVLGSSASERCTHSERPKHIAVPGINHYRFLYPSGQVPGDEAIAELPYGHLETVEVGGDSDFMKFLAG